MPSKSDHFVLRKNLSQQDLYQKYNVLLQEYNELRVMYVNASDAHSSMEKHMMRAVNDMLEYKDAYVLLKSKYTKWKLK